MKPTFVFKLKKESKWLTASAVMMGLAFFLRAFDFLGLRLMQGVSLGDMVLNMIIPMLAEATWCVYVRSGRNYSAKFGGILGAVLCLLVMVQTFFCGNVFLIVMGVLSCLLGGAAMILITWGFVASRRLGLLVFAAVTAIRILLFHVIGHISAFDWNGILDTVPTVCVLSSMTLFFGGIYPIRKE